VDVVLRYGHDTSRAPTSKGRTNVVKCLKTLARRKSNPAQCKFDRHLDRGGRLRCPIAHPSPQDIAIQAPADSVAVGRRRSTRARRSKAASFLPRERNLEAMSRAGGT